MFRLLPLLTLAACTRPQVLDDIDVTVAQLRAVVDAHADASTAATSIDEVAGLEPAYAAEGAALMAEMDEHMLRIGACYMPRDGHPMMQTDDAEATMETMRDDLDQHMAGHAEHAEVGSCRADEETHQQSMHALLDAMAGYSTGWTDDAMRCDD